MKEVYMIAGPNGCGKTTIAHKLLGSLALPFINADEIEKDIRSEKSESVRFQAGKLFFQQMDEYIRHNRSFVIETTFSGKNLSRISKLKANGYKIKTIFVFVETPEIAKQRIKERVRLGGHNIPDDDVTRRFYRSKNNFWHIYKIYLMNGK
ncbi:zeta toxin family protein [Candidatus Magnetomonas plexicatena]|uniref:zeta toxin family protein n=1 Tax=Candidatus Magnetomonas plexicatena TaxID=2552947 RepID=UPI001C78E7B5|nr:AAA family ATPase [Nitrospirales bacterium LBB_01]